MSMRMRSCDPPSCRTCRGERLSSLGTFALHVRHSLTPFTQPRISPVIHRGETLAGHNGRTISTISGHIWICIPVSRSSVLNSVFAENDCQNPPRPSRLYSTELATGTRHAAYRARRIAVYRARLTRMCMRMWVARPRRARSSATRVRGAPGARVPRLALLILPSPTRGSRGGLLAFLPWSLGLVR